MGIKGLAEEKAGCRARGSSAAAVTVAVDRDRIARPQTPL